MSELQALPINVQENLLTLLCFDEIASPVLVNILIPGLFDSNIYKDIAEKSINFYSSFKKPPGKHIADLLDDKLYGEDKKKAKLYQEILQNLFENQNDVNREYTLSQLNSFIKQQNMKSSIIKATKLIKEGDIEGAERAIQTGQDKQIDVFNPGIWLPDPKQSLRFFDIITNTISTGIQTFDNLGYGPAAGELFVILAPANRGKTMGMVHFGRYAAQNRYKVLHISLEMSEEKMAQRYMQSIYSLSKRQKEVRFAQFQKDELGKLTGIRFVDTVRPTLMDSGTRKKLNDKLNKYGNRLKLYIKRFPTNSLTVGGLEAYLDNMERLYNYSPDLIIVDYADLMKLDAANIRVDTGIIYKELRRIAVERNVAMLTASQSNRLGESSKVITLKHLAEDYSKAATADNIVAYCQTHAETRLGLARLFIAKARDEEREQSVLISQAYRISQFHTDDIIMEDRYWDELDALSGNGNSDEDENEQQSNNRRRTRPTPRN